MRLDVLRCLKLDEKKRHNFPVIEGMGLGETAGDTLQHQDESCSYFVASNVSSHLLTAEVQRRVRNKCLGQGRISVSEFAVHKQRKSTIFLFWQFQPCTSGHIIWGKTL